MLSYGCKEKCRSCQVGQDTVATTVRMIRNNVFGVLQQQRHGGLIPTKSSKSSIEVCSYCKLGYQHPASALLCCNLANTRIATSALLCFTFNVCIGNAPNIAHQGARAFAQVACLLELKHSARMGTTCAMCHALDAKKRDEAQAKNDRSKKRARDNQIHLAAREARMCAPCVQLALQATHALAASRKPCASTSRSRAEQLLCSQKMGLLRSSEALKESRIQQCGDRPFADKYDVLVRLLKYPLMPTNAVQLLNCQMQPVTLHDIHVDDSWVDTDVVASPYAAASGAVSIGDRASGSTSASAGGMCSTSLDEAPAVAVRSDASSAVSAMASVP